jgi:alkylresorcinol/alkylpyrone synthase
MLRNILTKEVPELAGRYAAQVLEELLPRTQFSREQLTTWVMHAGGRNILIALGQQLRLSESDLRWSAGVLRAHGNISSPCALFVLQAALQNGAPSGPWWMCSFGAGFSCHGALLEVE